MYVYDDKGNPLFETTDEENSSEDEENSSEGEENSSEDDDE